jgi:hypothetical protein
MSSPGHPDAVPLAAIVTAATRAIRDYISSAASAGLRRVGARRRGQTGLGGWLKRLTTVALTGLLFGCRGADSARRPFLCLPPVFDGGQRLHPLPAPTVYWLELLLRQHELCWRSPTSANEARVALFGNSAVYGFPLPVEKTFGALLNEHFAANDIPARLFNLAFVNGYQLRDAVILRESLPYRPDVIIYALTLTEFVHRAPFPYTAIAQFFKINGRALRALEDDAPPGLSEPIGRYHSWLAQPGITNWPTDQLRETGAFVRLGVHASAEAFVERLHLPVDRPSAREAARQSQYDCQLTRARCAADFKDWRQWNILAYLQELHETRGVEILIVNWPIAHEPVEDCYSVRYTDAAVAQFNTWLADEVRERGLDYVDLHDLLPADDFVDSVHVTAAGHERVAGAIAQALDPILARRAAGRPPGES